MIGVICILIVWATLPTAPWIAALALAFGAYASRGWNGRHHLFWQRAVVWATIGLLVAAYGPSVG